MVQRAAQNKEDETARMSFPAINQVDAYWEGLRNGRLMPERAEVDPRGMQSALQFAFMLEHVAPGVARFRVAGMHLNDLLGMEVRGMPVTSFMEPEARAQFAKALDKVINTPYVADIRLSSPRGIGRPAVTARMYLAPLATGRPGYHPRILGCLQSEGQIGRAPRRFRIENIHMRRIIASAAPSVPGAAPNVPETNRPNELAEPAPSFAPAPRTGDRAERRSEDGKPRLRLVKNDD